MIVDVDGNPWFKRAYVGKFLELKDIELSARGLEDGEKTTRSEFQLTLYNARGWCGPKDQQNKTGVFLSAYGVIYVIIKSKRPKGKELREWIGIILNKMQV